MATHIPPHTPRSPTPSPRPISPQSTIRQVTPSPETLRQQPAAANPQPAPTGRRPGHKRSTHHVDPLDAFSLPPSSVPASRIPQPTFGTGQNNPLKRSNAFRISPNTPNHAARSAHGPSQRQHRVLTPSGLERGRVEYYGSASAANAARRPREQPPHQTGPTISTSSPSQDQQLVQAPPDDDDPFTPASSTSSRPPQHQQQQFWLVQSPAPLPAEEHAADTTADQLTPTRIRDAHAASSSTMQAATRQPGIFSTPGRDEMERKNGRLQPFSVRDGPFTGVSGVEELQRARMGVEREGEAEEGKNCCCCCCCCCKCTIM